MGRCCTQKGLTPPPPATAGTPCPLPAPFPPLFSPIRHTGSIQNSSSITSQLPPTPPTVPQFPQPRACHPELGWGGEEGLVSPGIFFSRPTSAKAAELEGWRDAERRLRRCGNPPRPSPGDRPGMLQNRSGGRARGTRAAEGGCLGGGGRYPQGCHQTHTPPYQKPQPG